MKQLLFVLLMASPAWAGELHIEDIDLDRLRKALPDKWYISELHTVSAPDGWKESEGGKGIRMVVSREPYSTDLKKTKDGGLAVLRPEFTLCIMPQDFAGKSADGVTFKDGKLIRPEPMPQHGVFILSYGGAVGDLYVFCSDASFSDWKEWTKQISQEKKQP